MASQDSSFPIYPELEMDAERNKLVISMLEEFPSVRHDIIGYLQSEHSDEL